MPGEYIYKKNTLINWIINLLFFRYFDCGSLPTNFLNSKLWPTKKQQMPLDADVCVCVLCLSLRRMKSYFSDESAFAHSWIYIEHWKWQRFSANCLVKFYNSVVPQLFIRSNVRWDSFDVHLAQHMEPYFKWWIPPLSNITIIFRLVRFRKTTWKLLQKQLNNWQLYFETITTADVCRIFVPIILVLLVAHYLNFQQNVFTISLAHGTIIVFVGVMSTFDGNRCDRGCRWNVE